jgi:hypothetical protein
MLKPTFRLMGLLSIIFLFFLSQGQAEEQAWQKTITLPSGEVVCDLNGEWDSLWIGRGPVSMGRQERDILKITQQGGSFKGIRKIGNPILLKGSTAIEGELDKNGFKELIYTGDANRGHANGKISKDGNKIEIQYYTDFIVELTRK